MSISTILTAIFILIIDIVIITIDLKNKLIIAGKNRYRIIMPVIVIAFIIITALSTNFKMQDIMILVGILPLAFVGDKRGITEKGLLTNSYVMKWEKIESYSLKEKGDKYILYYKSKAGAKKITFKIEDKEAVKKYLLGIKQIRYCRK